MRAARIASTDDERAATLLALVAETLAELHRQPRRARAGANVTQMHYARRGVVTPEMEFIAIRENMKRDEMLATLARWLRPPAPHSPVTEAAHSPDE